MLKRSIFFLIIALMVIGVPVATAQDGDTTTEEQTDPTARARVDQALAHISGFLELETTISLALIESDDESIPYVTYSWLPVTYTTSAMGCPVAGVTYESREVPAFRVRVTVRGFTTYDYRISFDGSAVILCFFNGPSDTSIGLDLANNNQLGTSYDRDAITSVGLVGGPARVDQAMRHLSDYLNFRNTITWNRVQNNDPYIANTGYTWTPIFYRYSGTGCPTPIEEYATDLTYGFNVVLTVNNRDYEYYSNADGTLLILCLNGRASTSSIFPATDDA